MEDLDEQELNNEEEAGSADEGYINDSIPTSAKPSKPSTPLQAINHLFEISSRLDDVLSELNIITQILHKESDLKDVISSLQKSIAPFVTLASQGIDDAAHLLTPIQGVKMEHSKRDVTWRRKVLDDCKEKDSRSSHLKFVDAYVTSCYLNDEEFWRRRSKEKKSKPAKFDAVQHSAPAKEVEKVVTANNVMADSFNSMHAQVTALQQTPLQLAEDQKSVIIPPPANGTEFTKIEAISLLTRCTRNQRSAAIEELISKKYVPCRKSQLYEMIKSYKEYTDKGQLTGGVFSQEWGRGGRRSLGFSKPKDEVLKKNIEYKHKQPKMRNPSESLVLSFLPSNGSYYTKSEFIRLVNEQPGSNRSSIINYLIDNKLVPAKKSCMYDLLKNVSNDPNFVFQEEWGRRSG